MTLAAAFAPLAIASQASTPPDPPVELPVPEIKGADRELLDAVRRIATRVEDLRGQKFDRPPIAVRVPDALGEVVAEMRVDRLLDAERLRARGRAWADLGLGPAGAPGGLLRILAGDLAGIGFEPSGNRLLVSVNRLTAEDFLPGAGSGDRSAILLLTGVRPDEPVLGHLLMHVRQRERLGRDPWEPTTDALLAAMAWAEGEANLLAVRYLFDGLGMAEDVVELGLDPSDVLEGALVPQPTRELSSVERQLLSFVYVEGFARAVECYRRGGWSALDEAMRRRRTTTMVLHPESGGAVARPSADPSPPVEGLRRVDEDSLGEQVIVTLVSALSGKDNLGLLAGDGWVADRLSRWELDRRGADAGWTVWTTRWRSGADAEEFDYAFARSLASRFPAAELHQGPDGDRWLIAESVMHRIARREDEVRIEVAPAEWLRPPSAPPEAP